MFDFWVSFVTKSDNRKKFLQSINGSKIYFPKNVFPMLKMEEYFSPSRPLRLDRNVVVYPDSPPVRERPLDPGDK